MPDRIFMRKHCSTKKVKINDSWYSTYNISIQGMGFLTKTDIFAVGKKIFLSFEEIDLSGTLIHSTPIKIKNKNYFLNGLKYISVSNINELLTLILNIED